MTIPHRNLLNYYKTEFPFDFLFNFLKINEKREICFRLNNDIYIRYLTFKSVDEFRESVLRKIPTQIDVGAFYTQRPEKNSENIFHSRELVFDVDITDYERTCECVKQLCNDCFQIIKAAIEILNKVLREDFGFEKISFFFSGGKGIHCWVTDESVYMMRKEEREAICGYITASYKTDVAVKNIMKKYSVEEKNFIRIDKEVTANEKHLIKMPYVVHKNGNIAAPIDIKNIDRLALHNFKNIN